MPDDETIDLDLNEFSIDEAEELEQTTGIAFQEMNTRALPIAVLRAAIWIQKRRTAPDFTLADAGKVKLKQLGKPESPGNGKGAARPTRSVPARRR